MAEGTGEAEEAVLQRLPHLNHMLCHVLTQGYWKEAELLAESLAHVALLLPPNARAVVSGWGRAACANDSGDERTVWTGFYVPAGCLEKPQVLWPTIRCQGMFSNPASGTMLVKGDKNVSFASWESDNQPFCELPALYGSHAADVLDNSAVPCTRN